MADFALLESSILISRKICMSDRKIVKFLPLALLVNHCLRYLGFTMFADCRNVCNNNSKLKYDSALAQFSPPPP